MEIQKQHEHPVSNEEYKLDIDEYRYHSKTLLVARQLCSSHSYFPFSGGLNDESHV